MHRILIVDDEEPVLYSFQRAFGKDYQVLTARSGTAALEEVRAREPQIVFLDIRMPQLNGLQVLELIKREVPQLPVVMMTAFGDTQTAIEAMKLGAFDYLVKPFVNQEIRELIERGLRLQASRQEITPLRAHFPAGEDRIIGCSRQMREVYKAIGQVAGSEATVMIYGDSGTGKELVARAIHRHSRRKDLPFLAVNCAAIPETLLESELFGYEKGAFSGAESRRIGKFEQGRQGTLFLDEVGDMSPSTQTKILRVLQEKSFERLGGAETIHADVRIIAATNRDLAKAIEERTFREELYYRLNVVNIHLPPLRERLDDLPELVEFFIRKYENECQCRVRGISPRVMELLRAWSWPGNVRELENLVRRAMILCRHGFLLPEHFSSLVPPAPERTLAQERLAREISGFLDLLLNEGETADRGLFNLVLDGVERVMIEKSLARSHGNQVQAARMLGISRMTLRQKMKLFGLTNGVLYKD